MLVASCPLRDTAAPCPVRPGAIARPADSCFQAGRKSPSPAKAIASVTTALVPPRRGRRSLRKQTQRLRGSVAACLYSLHDKPTDAADCCDSDADTKPGQTAYCGAVNTCRQHSDYECVFGEQAGNAPNPAFTVMVGVYRQPSSAGTSGWGSADSGLRRKRSLQCSDAPLRMEVVEIELTSITRPWLANISMAWDGRMRCSDAPSANRAYHGRLGR